MSKIGPFQLLGGFGLGAVGLYIGYRLGAEAVEYSKTITENTDVLSYVVRQHPGLTKLVTTLGIGNIFTAIGGLSGGLVDIILGTREEEG